MSFALEIPNAASDLEVVADLTKRTISCSMSLQAPGDKKSTKARVNWLTRQLTKADPAGIKITATRPGRAEETQAMLADALKDASVLDSPTSSVVATGFEIFYLVDLAGKFAGSKIFIEQLEEAVPRFYEQVCQHVKAWAPPPPKLLRREADDEEAVEAVAVEEEA